MADYAAIETLNALLSAETGSLLTRMAEARPFVSGASAAEVPLLRQMVAEQGQHVRRLSDAIVALGGVPRPATPSTLVAGLHYLGVDYLLPRFVMEKHELIAAYRRAAERVSAPAAARALADNLANHEAHLSRLEALAAQTA